MSADTFHAVPAAGLIVRDPETRKPLPKKGKRVPRSTYWLRRLRDGSVTDRNATPPPAPPREQGGEAADAKRAGGKKGTSKGDKS